MAIDNLPDALRLLLACYALVWAGLQLRAIRDAQSGLQRQLTDITDSLSALRAGVESLRHRRGGRATGE
ncbi:hypothetical protein [Luteitalea sp.]